MLKKRLNNLLLVLSLFLPACYKRLHKKPLFHYYDEQPAFSGEAHLADIPLPVQANVRTLGGSPNGTTGLTFISTFDFADILHFYQFEMERLGWKELHLFSVTSEVLLVFEKPEKFCTISIRPDNRVVIFFGSRI